MRFSKSSKIIIALVALLMVLIPLSSCAPKATPEPVEEVVETAEEVEEVVETEEPEVVEATEEPVEEPTGPSGTLVVAHSEKMESLDPQARLQIHSYNIAVMLYDTLVNVSDDGEIMPRLATAWEQTDPLTWKFTLRDDVTFHNGEPFTSESVKFTLDRLTNPDTGSAQAGVWAAYVDVDTSDPYVAVIKTSVPDGTILTNLALTGMLPPVAGPSIDFTTNAVGTGPFKFVERVLDDHLTMEANENYWGDVPAIQTVIIRDIPEATTMLSAFETGEVDLVWGIPPEERDRVDNLPGLSVVEYPTFTVRFLWMNAGVEPFDNPLVRDAVRYAIDIDAIVDVLFAGQAIRATGCVAKGVVGYAPQPEFAYDPEKAIELLTEAGYPDGFDTEIKVPTYLPKQKEKAEVIAGYLADVGINAQVVIQDQALWIEDLLALNWDMNLLGTGTITGDADFTLRRIYTSAAKRTGFESEELDELLVAQQGEVDLDTRLGLLDDACSILWDDGPTVWTFQTTWLYGVSDKVQGFTPRFNQFIYFNELSLAD